MQPTQTTGDQQAAATAAAAAAAAAGVTGTDWQKELMSARNAAVTQHLDVPPARVVGTRRCDATRESRALSIHVFTQVDRTEATQFVLYSVD